MTDTAGWLVEAAALAGRQAHLVTDRLPADPTVTNLVVAPHEFFLLYGGTDAELNEAAAISVPICTEQPGTPWFFIGLSFCRPSALVFDINANGVDALRRLGVKAYRMPLGGVPTMGERARGSRHRRAVPWRRHRAPPCRALDARSGALGPAR